jgi:hypothetical protein
VSHPIPLHTAERLERALEASSQRVAARGPKGWVMRIVAYFACQYCEAVIGLLEGLLAEYRAGTLVLPGMLDDASAIPTDHATAQHPSARPGARRPSMRRVRAPTADPSGTQAAIAGQSHARYATPAPRRPRLTVVSGCPESGRHAASPRPRGCHPSAVPRSPAEKIAYVPPRRRTAISLRIKNNMNTKECYPIAGRARSPDHPTPRSPTPSRRRPDRGRPRHRSACARPRRPESRSA